MLFCGFFGLLGSFSHGDKASTSHADNPAVLAIARQIHKHDAKTFVDTLAGTEGERFLWKGQTYSDFGRDTENGRPTSTFFYRITKNMYPDDDDGELMVVYYADDATVCMTAPDPNDTTHAR